VASPLFIPSFFPHPFRPLAFFLTVLDTSSPGATSLYGAPTLRRFSFRPRSPYFLPCRLCRTGPRNLRVPPCNYRRFRAPSLRTPPGRPSRLNSTAMPRSGPPFVEVPLPPDWSPNNQDILCDRISEVSSGTFLTRSGFPRPAWGGWAARESGSVFRTLASILPVFLIPPPRL